MADLLLLLLLIKILTPFLLLSTFSSVQQLEAATPTTFSVADYGAVGDGKHYDTEQIQAAIEACHAAGGGHVRFPKGDYLTGTIYLRSGVVLDVEENATILGGTRLVDYPAESQRWYVVLAEKATNVGIRGLGEIDGQGRKFVEKMDERENVMVTWNTTGVCSGGNCRPRLVGFFDCRNVTLSVVVLREPAYWNLHIVRCEHTRIDDLIIEGDFNIPNNNGVHIEDSNNTVISNCTFENAADAITLATRTGPIYNLSVTQSTLRTRSSAIKLGNPSSFDFKGLLFDNIIIEDSHRGLVLEIRDRGSATDIIFSNIRINTRFYAYSQWWGRAEPIHVMTCPRDSNSKVGSISNLQFINISSHSENGVFLFGSSEGVLRNLKFINVNLTYTRSKDFEYGAIDYQPATGGCQTSRHVIQNKAGIKMEHIDGLQIEKMNMIWSKNSNLNEWNNALEFSPSNVNGITLLSFSSALISHEEISM